jgi:hypothetical protein
VSIGPGDIDAAILRGGMLPAPRMQRTTTSSLPLTTSWQRINFVAANLNEFPIVTDAGTRLVDWDGINNLITFNDQAGGNHEYMAFLTTEVTTTGVSAPPLLPGLAMQLRYVVPDAGGTGVHYYFPNHGAASGKEYVDFARIISDGVVVDQLPIHCPAGPAARAHGVGAEVRLSGSLPEGAAVDLTSSVLYMVAI